MLGWPILAWVSVLFLAVGLNRLDSGSVSPEGSRWVGDITSGTAATSLMAIFSGLTGNFQLATVLVASFSILLFLVNRIKISILHEPLVFSDIYLIPEIIRHPELYITWTKIPFIFIAPGIFVIVWWGISIPGTTSLDGYRQLLFFSGVMPIFVFMGLCTGRAKGVVHFIRKGIKPSFNAVRDAGRFTPLGAACLHVLWHTNAHHLRAAGIPNDWTEPAVRVAWRSLASVSMLGVKPHLILIQSESFCDVRRYWANAPKNILTTYDELVSTGCGGRLAVAWRGAYTMRTEFSILTGLGIDTIGSHGFDPYHSAAKKPLWSLSRYFGENGYDTVCLHPFDPKFFRRHRVMPNLGFARFISEEAFIHAERNGPYVSDAALARYAIDLLRQAARPTFLFIITMEAHGPWLTERFSDSEDKKHTPIDIYLDHIKSSDEALAIIRDALLKQVGPTVLGFYGDHLPGIQTSQFNVNPSKPWTDYLIWSNVAGVKCEKRDLNPEHLGGILLETMKLVS